MGAKTVSQLTALGALALLFACDGGNRGGVALCVNPSTQGVEQCCVADNGTYVACSTVAGDGGDMGGDALVRGDAGSTDGSGGGDDGSVPTEDTAVAPDTGTGLEDTGTPVEDTGTPVEDTGTPVEDTGTPVEDTGTPVEDTGTPVEDTETPVEDTETPTGDAGEPVSDTGSCEECVLGDTLCDDEVTRQVCEETTPGCTAWKYVGCPEGTACADGSCAGFCDVELPCAAPGQKKCDGKQAQTCTEVAPGCAGWVTEESCTANQTCKEGACVTVVECPQGTKCTKLGDTMCDGTGKAVLACEPLPADETCLQWVTDQTCAGTQVCQNAACVAEGTLSCSELIGCVSECQTAACNTNCKLETSTVGQSQYNAMNDCANANCGSLTAHTSAFNACYMEKCKTDVLACDGYFVPGYSGCGTFMDCQAGCGLDKTCASGCVDAIDYTGFVTLLKLYACVELKCDPYYTSGTTAYSTCVQTSCGAELSTCTNDI